MNQLSWLLYWADVASNLGKFFVIFGMVAFITFCVMMIVTLLDDYDSVNRKTEKAVRLIRYSPVPALLLLAAVFTPSRETMYAIAASEYGEQLLHTKTATLAEQALNAWLERQIHPEK